MNDRDHNSNGRRTHRRFRDDRRIDHWVTLKRIVDVTNREGKLPLKLNVIIERPEFTNGERGFGRVSMTIGVGNYYVRLATKATITLLDLLAEHRGAILDAVDEVHGLNQQVKEEQGRGRQQDRRRRSKDIPVAEEDYPLLTDESLDFRRTTRRTRSGRGRSYHPSKDKGR
jgi:hypothetical protein